MYSELKQRTMWITDKVFERLDGIVHLKEHNMTYIEHFTGTLEQSKFFLKNGFYLLLHAFFPHLYPTTIECKKFK